MINDAEWQGAESVNALQTTNHQLSPRQTRFWMTWDEDNLYMAMRSPLRQGERLIQALRDRSHDINVVFDDSYEVWLDVGSTDPKTGLVAFFQFLCNYAGARYDVLHQPSVGNSSLSWSSGWEPKTRVTPDGKCWEWEMAIPRQSVYKATPFAEGFKLSCLIARNFKRPWEQNSFEGTSSFAVLETHSKYVLSKTAPAIHLLAAADSGAQTLGLQLAACGTTGAGQLKWRFDSDGGVSRTGTLAFQQGKFTAMPPELALDKPGTGDYRIRVTSADDKTTYLDWCAKRQFGDLKILDQVLNDTGDQVGLALEFNPVHNYVRVTGDFINYDNRAAIDHCQVTATDAAGKTLGQQDLKLDDLAYVRGVLRLPDLPFGEYQVKLTCLGKDGREVLSRDSKFSKKDHAKEFAWWKTPHGSIEKVVPPWTPVKFDFWEKDDAGVFHVWGRDITIGAAGLPKQVTTQEHELLAAPATLVAVLGTGESVAATLTQAKEVSLKAHRGVIKVGGALGPLAVTSQVTVEFDGMHEVELTLEPGKAPVAVKTLKVIVPLKNEVADYIHATGEGIRTGFYYGFVPKTGTGRLWDCLTVDSQPMVVGSFIPYLWIGNPQGGLCWFADSDAGWDPNDKVPAIEIRRDGPNSTDLVLNLISADATLDKPRTIVFAFQASPVKPMAPQWRMDSWWCGDTFRDYSCSGDIIWTARPFTMDKEKCKAMVAAQHQGQNAFIFGVSKYPANAVPYFIHQSLPAHIIPEVKYFGDEWRTSISECLYYGDTLNDYMIHNLYTWAKECGIDGYYIDNMRPVACDNLDAGRGWKLPDGRIQPTYQMFSTRQYFLRMRAAFLEANGHSKVVLHMTNNMILPWVGPADVAYDGEHHVIYPEMGKDFMDFWSLERLRSDYSGQWGVPVNFMHEYQGEWDHAKLFKAMRAYTGAIILHDALPSGNSNGLNQPVWIGRDKFGIEADDVRFVGYWDAGAGLKSASPDVRLAAWVRPPRPGSGQAGKVLLAVVNFGDKTDAKVTVDPQKLGLAAPGAWAITDAEAGTSCKEGAKILWDAANAGAVTHDGQGTLVVPVDRHDYRLLIIQ